MTPSLQRLIALAEDATPLPGRVMVGFEVYAPEQDAPVATGRYRPDASHDRAAFGQAVGKLLAAGYEVLMWRESRPLQ